MDSELKPDLNLVDLDNIVFYGDPHGDFSDINKILKERKPAAIFILGDLEYGFGEPLFGSTDTKIYAVSGNHDTGLMFDNVEFIDWNVVTVSGIRFLGLGNYPSGDMKILMESQKDIDVLLCHYPLGCVTRDTQNCPISEVYDSTGAHVYFHGHIHSSPLKLLNGAYAGKRTGYTDAVESHPSVNATNSAITLALERVDPPQLDLLGWAIEYVICEDKEIMTVKERDQHYDRVRSLPPIERHDFVVGCINKIQKKVTDSILSKREKYVNGPLIGKPVKALKLRHTKDWILIGEDNQITTTTVPTLKLGGVMNNKMLFTDNLWSGQTPKQRFNSVYLVELNGKVSDKLTRTFDIKVS